MGMSEQAGKVANTAVEAMRSVPLGDDPHGRRFRWRHPEEPPEPLIEWMKREFRF
jgi:hypothetical protein